MALAKIIKYEGDNSTFVWKSPIQDFNTMSQLIVHESQEAVFFKNGQALDVFEAGRYTLQTQNIPLIKRFLNLPTGGKTPFHCEVYFINKTQQMAIKWGTDSQVQYMEPTYKFPLQIGVSGEMTLSVSDSRRLLVKLVGTESQLTQAGLVAQFRSYLMSIIKPYIASTMQNAPYALRYSSGEKNAFYQESAKTIDEIQRGIISISRKEKPFDIFISYKETDVNGNRTKDSVVAQKLYDKLVSEGYKVFFSRITLEDKIGSEYEPYIYAALSSSKVMLTVCSSKDNIEAPWVKNEWSRFLTIRQADSSKTLIPLFFEMSKEDLPDEFSVFPAQDIGKEDYEQELIRGIKKLIPLPIMLAEKRKRIRKKLGIASIIIVAIVIIAGLISLPYINENIELQNEYDAAMELYENGKYSEAISAFEKISDFRDSKEMIQKSEDGISTIKYNEALQLYYDGNYPEAAWAFRKLNGFSDSKDQEEKAELAWRNLLSTVATNNRLGSMSQGAYYISANGSVETFDFDPGDSNKNIEINEHGKIVSIADNYELYALHEDGYVTNSKKNNKLDLCCCVDHCSYCGRRFAVRHTFTAKRNF